MICIGTTSIQYPNWLCTGTTKLSVTPGGPVPYSGTGSLNKLMSVSDNFIYRVTFAAGFNIFIGSTTNNNYSAGFKN